MQVTDALHGAEMLQFVGFPTPDILGPDNFAEHRVGNVVSKANGVTFEADVPAEHEVYFSIADSTHFRASTMTLTHHCGMDIKELDKSQVVQIAFAPLTGLKAFVVANALSKVGAPKQLILPLVQQLPKPRRIDS